MVKPVVQVAFLDSPGSGKQVRIARFNLTWATANHGIRTRILRSWGSSPSCRASIVLTNKDDIRLQPVLT
jgi:hypothetical protein